MNYTGGFIGHLGKSGTVDLDSLGALGELLSAGAGVMDIFRISCRSMQCFRYTRRIYGT